MSSLLSVHDVHKSFVEGVSEIQVLRGISFDLAAGERLAIMGESGVGKSTLLHVLGTLDRPTKGKILYHGRELPVDDAALCQFRNQQIGFVFQFHYLLPDFTALENVMLPALIQGRPATTAQAEAAELLELVGLKDRMGHRPSELSGGQCQRVAVARALVNRPTIVLGDEPTGNLDSRTAQEIMALFDELAAAGTTIILVTHEKEIAAHARREIRMRDGRIA